MLQNDMTEEQAAAPQEHVFSLEQARALRETEAGEAATPVPAPDIEGATAVVLAFKAEDRRTMLVVNTAQGLAAEAQPEPTPDEAA